MQLEEEREEFKKLINDWYSSYSNDIYSYIFMLIRDHEQAKDILQETFVNAFKKYDLFQGGNQKAWLFRIARNLAMDHFRKKKPIAYLFDSSAVFQANEPTPEQLTLLNESERELYISINKLKRSYRDVIILRKIKEFSIKDSSVILGWSESKVKVTLYRAMKALKKEMKREGYIHETF